MTKTIRRELLIPRPREQVWWAITEPYQLSASYVVDFVLLPAGAEPIAVSPVLDKRIAYGARTTVGA